ncbi:MAG: DUF4434 domain-containing protein, partial [Oscillospiraceae bacterium]
IIFSNISSVFADYLDVPKFTGTFVQPWLYKNWDEQRAENEFKRMNELGIDTLIMGDTAIKDDKWTIEYPSKIDDFNNANFKSDNVKYLLDLCKKYKIKLYLGIGMDKTWNTSVADLTTKEGQQWFEQSMEISVKMVKELYDLYKKDYNDVFCGYYFVYEIFNNKQWNDEIKRKEIVKTLSNGFNFIINRINQIDKNMPLIFSTFSTNDQNFATKENTQKFYTEFISATNFRKVDVISPMDNCGGGGQTINSLDEWTTVYYNAVKFNNDKLLLWSNCESFIQPSNLESGSWTTAPLNRFIKQLEITSKYSSKIISFSYPHYMSPYNTISGFDKAYENYLKTGKIDTTPPSIIKRVKTEIIDDSLVVRWTPAEDEFDIAQYKISKLNSYSKQFDLYAENLVGREDGKGLELNTLLKCSFIDKYYNKKSKNVYIIEAMDCSGNFSEKAYIVVDGTNP